MLRLLLSLLLVFSLSGCLDRGASPNHPDSIPEDMVSPDDTAAFHTDQELLEAHPEANAVVRIEPTTEQEVSGYVTFQQMEEGLLVTAYVTGLDQPRHGFHIHENGSCEPGADGDPAGAAGGHFNPQGHDHGAPENEEPARHVGDFGNLEPNPDGIAQLSFVDPLAALSGENNIIGRAIVVHDQEDDLVSQPTGDAGGRIGCGIIAARQ